MAGCSKTHAATRILYRDAMAHKKRIISKTRLHQLQERTMVERKDEVVDLIRERLQEYH